MTKILTIMAGGAIGTLARYAVSSWMQKAFTGFPYGTLTVNVAGSLIIGLLWGVLESSDISANARSFIFIGLLGGFTTFSSFSLETLQLLKLGEIKPALLNILANNALGLLAVWLGFIGARGLLGVSS